METRLYQEQGQMISRRRIDLLQQLFNKKLLYVLQTGGVSSHADNEIQSVLTNYRIQYKSVMEFVGPQQICTMHRKDLSAS